MNLSNHNSISLGALFFPHIYIYIYTHSIYIHIYVYSMYIHTIYIYTTYDILYTYTHIATFWLPQDPWSLRVTKKNHLEAMTLGSKKF